ncbi:MAG: L,D-transpeptidase [Acidobacteriia bacterium]|nr:L,D-transpeptidase [Terriglobia bacterium]
MKRTGGRSKAYRFTEAMVLALALTASRLAAAQNARPDGDVFRVRSPRHVLVSIPDRKLAVLADGRVIRTFPVAVGAAVSPSPTGEFHIVHRVTDPTYYHSGVVIPPGPDNPVGTRWVGLNQKGYGIHGTNEPSSIGKARSHGCIRMRNRDVEQFFAMVNVGDTVEIRSERDEQTAEVLGTEADTTAAAVAQVQGPDAGVSGGQ